MEITLHIRENDFYIWECASCKKHGYQSINGKQDIIITKKEGTIETIISVLCSHCGTVHKIKFTSALVK